MCRESAPVKSASHVRLGRDSDAACIIALIGACWSQYPGVYLDVDGEMPELRALASYYQAHEGCLWIAEGRDAVIGMIATKPIGPAIWEICRVYVHPEQHGSGLAHHMLDLAEAHAAQAGAERLVLWSDTRFERAHRFYEKRSYVRAGPIRILDDISHSLEFRYAKPIDGIERLDAAGAASAERRLSDILVASVAAGGSLSFLPPLAPDTAQGVWRAIAKDVAAGTSLLFGAWKNGVLSGSVVLALASSANQQHRAEVRTLIVDPEARRQGLARGLLECVEREAISAGRRLLTFNTRERDVARPLYRERDWHEAGRIPGFILTVDGMPEAALFLWKRLD
jgi:GNAT superfamily N-acetyltransferase